MCSLPAAKETSLKNPEIGSMSISSSKMTWQCRIQQECIPVGCVPSATVAVSGGVCSGGGLLPGDVCSWRDVCPQGVVSKHALRQTPLRIDRHLLKHNLRNFVGDGNKGISPEKNEVAGNGFWKLSCVTVLRHEKFVSFG